MEVLQLVAQACDDDHAFSLINKRCRDALRSLRTGCVATAMKADDVAAIGLLLASHPALKQLEVNFRTPASPNLSRMAGRMSGSALDFLALRFPLHLPAPRSYASLSALAGITSLLLSGGTEPPLWVNRNGELSALAGLPALRQLALENPASDQSLEALHQVTEVYIKYPSHGEAYEDDLECPMCGNIHPEALEEFVNSLNFAHIVHLGRGLGGMCNLEVLELDFNVGESTFISANGVLNTFRISSSGQPGASSTIPAFPKLEALGISCTGDRKAITHWGPLASAFEEWNRAHDANDPLSLRHCGASWWPPARMWEAFQCMPSLQTILLGVHPGDEEHDILLEGIKPFQAAVPGGSSLLRGEYSTSMDKNNEVVTMLEVHRPAKLDSREC